MGLIGTLIGLIFVLIILGVIWWAVQRILGLFTLGEPFGTLVHVLVVIVFALVVLWVVKELLGLAGIPVHFGGVTFR